MSLIAFKMMTLSGVLRPSDLTVRRGQGGLPLYVTSQLPEFLNHSLDVLFGSSSESHQTKGPHRAKPLAADLRSSAQPAPARFSLKTILIQLGLLHEGGKAPTPEPPPAPISTAKLEKRVQILASLLRAEHARCQKQVEELAVLRSRLTSIDELQADLAIEREAGKQLVEWLQEAEQQLGVIQSRRVTLVGVPQRNTSYFP